VSTHTILSVQLVAFWPVWQWYASRVREGEDNPFGVVALVTALVFLWCRGRRRRASAGTLLCATAAVTLYSLTYPVLPPVFRAALGLLGLASSVAATCSGRALHLGFSGLLLLSLPILASLHFYIGYPARMLTTWVSSHMLHFVGLDVHQQGTCLLWGNQLVMVDAPCSGIKMLWTSLYLNFTLAVFGELSSMRTWVAYSLSMGVVFLGNVVRTTVLFLLQACGVELSSTTHSGVGLVVFALVCAAIVTIHRQLRRGLPPSADVTVHREPTGRLLWAFFLGHLMAFMLPFLPSKASPTGRALPFPGWPRSYAGRPLEQRPLLEGEVEWGKEFPGQMARFSDSAGTVHMKWVHTPTRMVHTIDGCMRNVGYVIEPGPVRIDSDGTLWGQFTARRGDERLRVSESIRDAAGQTFSDASSWYWAAMVGRSPGPWWSTTLIRASR
jgi:exosortase/archaeosortase family protein